jgi:hypothetical protein
MSEGVDVLGDFSVSQQKFKKFLFNVQQVDVEKEKFKKQRSGKPQFLCRSLSLNPILGDVFQDYDSAGAADENSSGNAWRVSHDCD